MSFYIDISINFLYIFIYSIFIRDKMGN